MREKKIIKKEALEEEMIDKDNRKILEEEMIEKEMTENNKGSDDGEVIGK